MSAAGARAYQPVGSAAWIAAEKENVMNLVEQEMEEVEFPVRHELEWLNEHMAEIFSRNQFNLTEIFKTPGKLRGKTPRTARKRNVDEARVPLSDIFSSHNQVKSPSKAGLVSDQAAVKAADNSKGKERSQEQTTNQKLNSFSTYNTDSGYHGMPDEDEVVLPSMRSEAESSTQPTDTQPLDTQPLDTQPLDTQPSDTQPFDTQPVEEDFKRDTRNVKSPSVDRRTTEGSFHSAQEDIQHRSETVEPADVSEDQETKPDEDTPRPIVRAPEPPRASVHAREEVPDVQSEPSSQAEKQDKDGDMVLDNQFDDIGSPSDGSTPDRPLIRKSSLTFASLPAREPLVTKKSMGGARISRTSHVDIAKLSNAGRPSYFSGQLGGRRTTRALPEGTEDQKVEDDKMDLDGRRESLHEATDMDLETTKLHHKSSTQRLHEKISLLGKFQPSRTTKSIPSVSHLAASQVNYPELPNIKQDGSSRESRIAPAPEPAVPGEGDETKTLSSPHRPNIPKSHRTDAIEHAAGHDTARNLEKERLERTETFHDFSDKHSPLTKTTSYVAGHQESASTSIPSSPQRPGTRGDLEQKPLPVQNLAAESTTPPVSPKRNDGALSMSKSKLQSLMKTAKGLFTSSAGVSAAAKLETLSSSPSASRSQTNLGNLPGSPERRTVQSPSPLKQPDRTQNATEPEERSKQTELKHKQRQEELFETSREQEKTITIQESKAKHANVQEKSLADREGHETTTPAPSNRVTPKKAQRPPVQTSKEVESNAEAEPKFPLPPTSHNQPQPAKSNDRRPVKPTREPVQKPKPQPVSIRVGSTLSRQMPLSSTPSLSSSVQESNPPPAPTPAAAPAQKQPTLTKKASNSSLQTASSSSSFKSSVSSQTQRKAQLAAEKKKQEEREARRKEEQKRELERKRAAQQQQQEEARRQELKNRADAERRERERLAAEDPKKAAQRQAIEQRRLENARRLERQGSQPPNSASDLGSILQQEKASAQSSQRADLGSTRPPSRLGSAQPFSRSITQPPVNAAKPAKRALDEESQPRPTPHQTAESKRRKTEDEQNPLPPVRPTMAPPIRQSNIRKEPAKPQIFAAHGYPQAPPPAAHHQTGASLYKSAAAGSHHVQQAAGASSHRPGHPMDMAKYASGKIPFADAPNPSQGPTVHKTPNQSSQHVAAKSSPQYPNGENIHLPEIPTDSEDEDSDAEMLPVPKWAQPKELEALLREQEGRETESIFGPIAPFSLEETFKADKKIKKFRERTSSANWSGPDGLTQEEIRRDIAERQRLRMNGGWVFNAS